MRKALILFLLVIFVTAASFPFDFGGNLGDSTLLYKDNPVSVYHSDILSLWVSTPVITNLDFFAQGSYTYSTSDPYAFDLDYFKFENKSLSFLNYTIGRFDASDFSGYVFKNKLDGIIIGFNPSWGSINITAGYTGLLFNRSSSVEMTLSDQHDKRGLFDLEAKRIVIGAEVTFPGFFLKQDVSACFWKQYDARNSTDVSPGGGKLNTQYIGAKIGGALLSSLYYDTAAFWGRGLSYVGNTTTKVLSFMGYAGVRYYMPEVLSSKVDFKFLYSSGDKDYKFSFLEGNTAGDINMFIPVTKSSLALVFSPSLGNIFFSRLNYSLKPFSFMDSGVMKNLQFEVTDVNFFRSTTGQISESGIDPASASLYLGTEIDGAINFRPWSDLGLALSGGVFIPNNGTSGAFDSAQRDIGYTAGLTVSFAF